MASSMPSLALKPSEARDALARAMSAGLVPIIRSSPGIGKSDILHDLAKKGDFKLIDFRLSQADITDLNGLPGFKNGRAEYCPFTDFPLEGDELPIKYDADGNTRYEADGTTPLRYRGWLLFFDELNAAPKQIQAAAYKILLDRKVGQRNLHKNVIMACAGNLETDMAVTHGMSTALQSRLVHLEMRVDKDEWIKWAIANGIDSRILAYIEFQPGKLHEFKPDHTDKTFACPRTWAFASKLIDGVDKLTLEEDGPLLSGTLSQGIAYPFIEFCNIYNSLPKLSDIVANPTTTPIPNEVSTRFALAMFIAEKIETSNADPLIAFLMRLPVEARVLCLRMIRARKPSVVRHPKVAEICQTLLARLK